MNNIYNEIKLRISALNNGYLENWENYLSPRYYLLD